MSKPSRRELLARCLEDDARADLVAFAVEHGVAQQRAGSVADSAAVRAFRRGVPRDRRMLDTLLRLEVRRQLAAEEGPGKGAAAAPAGALSRPALSRRIRRARLRRLSLVAGAAAAACAATLGVALAISQVDRAPSTVTAPAAPAVRPPAVVEEPTTPPTPRVLGPVSDVPGLPVAEPLLEGMIEGAGAGWSLVELEVEDVDDTTFLYLKDPDGTLYEIPTSLGERTWWRSGWIVEWLPGTRLVLVTWGRQAEAAVVDVLTGERLLTIPYGLEGRPSAVPAVAFVGDGSTDVLVWWVWPNETGSATAGIRMVRLGLDGSERGTRNWEFTGPDGWFDDAAISPDGTRVALDAPGAVSVLSAGDLGDVASAAHPVAADSGSCHVQRWLGDDSILLTCYDAGPGGDLWVVDVGSGETTFLGHGLEVGTAWAVGDGLVVARREDYSEGQEYAGTVSLHLCGRDGVCSDEPVAEVPGWPTVGVADDLLHAYAPPYEVPRYGEPYTVLDLTTGQVSGVLEPGPDVAVGNVVPWGRAGIIFSTQ